MPVPSKGSSKTKSKTTRARKNAESTILTESATPTAAPVVENLGHLLQAPADVAFRETPISAPNSRFFFRHWPREWEVELVDGKNVWLPILSPHILRAGTGNIRTLAPHEQHAPHRAYETAVMDARRKGWVYVDPSTPVPEECLPANVPPGGYLRSIDVVTRTGVGGKRWLTAWTIPVKTLPGERQKWHFDRNGYNAWRKNLVEGGQISPPDDDVRARVIAKHQRHINRNRIKPIPADLRAENVGKITARFEAAKEATIPGVK